MAQSKRTSPSAIQVDDGVSEHSADGQEGEKRVEGSAAAGTPITTIDEDDATVLVPAKYLDENYFIIRAQGDSMIDAGINSGDFCVFQKDAYRDAGLIMYVQVDGATDLPDGAIKRVFFHGNQVELRSANPAYEPMFYYANEVSLNGVLADVISSEGKSCEGDGV